MNLKEVFIEENSVKEKVRLKTFEVENHLERIYINGTNLFNDAWFINI